MTTSITPAVLTTADSFAITTLAAAPIIALIALILQRAISTSSSDERSQRISQATSVVLVPLVIIFIFAVLASFRVALSNPF